MQKLLYDSNNLAIIRKVNEIIDILNEQQDEKEKEDYKIIKELGNHLKK